MSLKAGDKLGPYEITGALGAGGMGEVYRARDPRLGREVAIKVLPTALSKDPDRLRRFEQEARAAGALNHPNILVIYDTGTHDGAPYVVSELLEGETLRERLKGGAIPPRKAVDLAIQIAHGLAAAHEKGIAHRDLKPENIFLTRDSRAKILDFGLAKLAEQPALPGQMTALPTIPDKTAPGVILGTVGYMSPEQVRGEAADHRSDIFSFGAILYEMVCGERAFQKGASVETMTAILKEDPPDLASRNASVPPALERVVGHCLEKRREDRFQSTRDLAFALEAISSPSEVSGPARVAGEDLGLPARRRALWAGVAALAIVGAALAAYVLGGRGAKALVPVFHTLTFRRGWVHSARFAPDGQSVIYAASWDGTPFQVFSVRPGSPESRPLELPPADVFSISNSGELAISLGHHFIGGFISLGVLARTPLGGGAPRELLENTQWADWGADGTNLAVVRTEGGRNRLEYPIGKVLYETAGWISSPRVSPQGDRIAFLDHPVQGDDGGQVAVVDLAGKKSTLSDNWLSEWGLAWSPDGREVWFTATKVGNARALYAVSLSGRERLILRAPGALTLHDVGRDGRVLLTRETWRLGISALPPGMTQERDLSWFDWSLLRDLSADGRTILFDETGEAGGTTYGVYLRKTDGSSAVRLGDGVAMALSPDGKWALAIVRTQPPQLVMLPTGPGEARTLERGHLERYHWAAWFPDGQRVLIAGNEPGHAVRCYVQELKGGEPKAITPEGVATVMGSHSLSPDGRWLATVDVEQKVVLYSVEGGQPRPALGVAAGERPSAWSADGHSLYVYRRDELPARVYRVDFTTGRRVLWRTLTPSDPAGLQAVMSIQITPDAKSFAYSYARDLSDLYLVEGLK